MAASSERVPVFPELIKHVLKDLQDDETELVVTGLNNEYSRNCRMLVEDELPAEPVDSALQKEAEKLQAEIAADERKLEEKREAWPELQRRHRAAVRVNVPDSDKENTSADNDIDVDVDEKTAALQEDLKRWQGGVLVKHAELNLEQINRTKAHAARVRKAVAMHANAVVRGEAHSEETTIILDVTPTGTPEASAKEAFAKRGLSLPMMSPNVTPRSRKVRRKLSSKRRLTSMR